MEWGDEGRESGEREAPDELMVLKELQLDDGP